MASSTIRLERVWDNLCAQPELRHRRFLLLDVYTALIVHEQLVTPREAVLTLVLQRDRKVPRALMDHICNSGHVVEALCWLRQNHPNLLRSKQFDPEWVPEAWRYDTNAPRRYANLRASVKLWLKAWSQFV